MDKEILVMEVLSDEMIKAGKKLVQALDNIQAQVEAAFWIYYADERTWKLFISSELVKSDGPRSFYKKIMEASNKIENDTPIVSLHNVVATDKSNTFVNLLKLSISTGDEISGIRFSKNMINGIYIEDAYIYRMKLTPQG